MGGDCGLSGLDWERMHLPCSPPAKTKKQTPLVLFVPQHAQRYHISLLCIHRRAQRTAHNARAYVHPAPQRAQRAPGLL